MSDSTNPYENSQTEPQEQEFKETFGAITERMISSIKNASSWVRFLSICGFIYAGLILVPTVLMLVLFPFAGPLRDNLFAAEIGIDGALFGFILFCVVLILGAVIIIPLLFLHNFGSKMRMFVQTNNTSALELAFKNNKSFWKFCGIFTIISLALIPVSLIIIGVFYYV